MKRYWIHPLKSGGIGAPPVPDPQTVVAELVVNSQGEAHWAVLIPAYTAALEKLFIAQNFEESYLRDGLSHHALTLVSA